jgi:hypothetical protein
MDLFNYRHHLGYRLTRQHGLSDSFERELYDMSRSAFIKYNLQARIGGMDGIFVAYHNTAELFGFQYLAREWIDEAVFGSRTAGDLAFSYMLRGCNHLLDVVCSGASDTSTARLTLALAKDCSRLSVFVEQFDADYVHLARPSDKFSQFLLSSMFRADGARLDAFPGALDNLDRVQTRLTLTVQQQEPNRDQFEQARQKCNDTRYDEFSISDIARTMGLSGVTK